jgi:metallophosphoesterase (TIGR00282 family)
MLGDVVGENGLDALSRTLPLLKRELSPDVVVVNGENAADGYGMTVKNYSRIIEAGADVVTSGNHVWEIKDFRPILACENAMLRPANYPEGAAGKGYVIIEKNGIKVLVINLQGREFMSPIDCPFKTFDKIYDLTCATLTSSFITLVDFHAESNAEKEAFALYVDGRASAVCGTHTHVQTADERILNLGTAYITDLGMTGPTSGIIGMDMGVCFDRVRTQVAYRLVCAKGPSCVQGVVIKIDEQSGRSITLSRIDR